MKIEDPLRSDVGGDRIPAGGVHHALRFTGRSGGIEDIKRMFGIERFGRTFIGGFLHQVVPPVVAT